ncbi:aspartate kinase [Sporosalibacterium faouarense]|uniref:aspartate kinase n=1 Tax=Sporosalibacterium faouarense TaxID=516123 RepID=UPI00141CD7EC|nr:aspartate kinase [Sporosalibacterium faouarense]MTI48049.1 aspartate kinase [Bacillota bacterium]
MKIAIQKFGGTSVANTTNRTKVVDKIIKQCESGYSVVVVVSAIGRKGDPYATDTLLNLVDKEGMNPRELDLLMSCGEIISGVVLSNVLKDKGYDSTVLTGYQAGIITDNKYGDADVLRVNPDKVLKDLKLGKIVIVTGFQGATSDGEITTLGRGGSDTTAVLLGEALNCEYVEIYTDVDGIMTADPRVVPDARLLEIMSYSEVYQLAEDGAKIIHPRAVEIAERSHIKLIIRNTLNDGKGTLIKDKDCSNTYKKKDRIINAITYKKNRTQVIIVDKERGNSTEKLMDMITRENISIDLINFFSDKKVFTIDKKDIKTMEKILKKEECDYNIVKDCCKLSIIGNRMQGIPGVMSRIVKALSKEDIQILQTSDSHATIWCLIKDKDLEKAVNSLHHEFNLSKKPV